MKYKLSHTDRKAAIARRRLMALRYKSSQPAPKASSVPSAPKVPARTQVTDTPANRFQSPGNEEDPETDMNDYTGEEAEDAG